jgi:hypothetical protein
VACGAGELVEQTSDLSGSQWTTSALYLQGISLVRRNNEWHHFDPLGTAQVITNNSASVISNNLYDVFGVLRHEQGSAETPWRWRLMVQADEYLNLTRWGTFYYSERGLPLTPLQKNGADPHCEALFSWYMQRAGVQASLCAALCAGFLAACLCICGIATDPVTKGVCVAICFGVFIAGLLVCKDAYLAATGACYSLRANCYYRRYGSPYLYRYGG